MMAAREKHAVQDVFTPTKPAHSTFVERESIWDRLIMSLETPGKQIVIYGDSGSGKTTLIENKLYQTYEKHITTRCMSDMGFEEIILNAFDQLDSYYPSSVVRTRGRQTSASSEFDYRFIKAQIGRTDSYGSSETIQRRLPPQLTVQALAHLMGQAGVCWVLDDFHKVDDREKVKIAQSMKVFMDMASLYNGLKIIAIGAVDTARQVIQYDSEMRNRVSELLVPLMNEHELYSIVHKGEDLLNIRFLDSVKRQIIECSSGLASVCHQLCLYCCLIADVRETSAEPLSIDGATLDKAMKLYVEDAADTLKSSYDRAVNMARQRKHPIARLIVDALLKSNPLGARASEILGHIRSSVPQYTSSNLNRFLKTLQSEERGRIIRYEPDSGLYSFSDSFHRVYAMLQVASETRRIGTGSVPFNNASSSSSYEYPQYLNASVDLSNYVTTSVDRTILGYMPSIMQFGQQYDKLYYMEQGSVRELDIPKR